MKPLLVALVVSTAFLMVKATPRTSFKGQLAQLQHGRDEDDKVGYKERLAELQQKTNQGNEIDHTVKVLANLQQMLYYNKGRGVAKQQQGGKEGYERILAELQRRRSRPRPRVETENVADLQQMVFKHDRYAKQQQQGGRRRLAGIQCRGDPGGEIDMEKRSKSCVETNTDVDVRRARKHGR